MNIEQQFVAITLDDGSTAIMGFVTQGRGSALPHGAQWVEGTDWWRRDPTDENIFEEIGRTGFSGRQAVKYRNIDPADIPQDRTYRNALIDTGKKLTFDMGRAREIHKDRLRRMRAPLFEKNDLALRDAILDGDQEKIGLYTSRRDALRAVTDDIRIGSAKTIDDLKVAIPQVLAEE